MARARRNPEEEFQIALVQWMRVALPAKAVCWATPNGGLRRKKTAARLKAGGVVAGIPDLFVLYKGALYGIELKAPAVALRNGKLSRKVLPLSPDQVAMHNRLNLGGCETTVCRSIAETEEFLRANGVPLRASVLAR